ncbi:hypothetical protein SAMN04488522_102363 [Pedobacter caeni]|uniref:Uncharacterized protein n=1 Tax=Pedobacter caeni TaxID=288992 RepID=A0A1M4ZL31_9SPHI|nr:hypothetical protein SAMN04488522_102363 [Pedobacter caeni]
MTSLFGAVLVFLSLLNICVLMLTVLMLKPIWIGLSAALFIVLMEAQSLLMKWKRNIKINK